VVGLLAAGTLIAGAGGLVVVGGALLLGWRLHDRQPAWDTVTLGVVPAGLIVAGALLSRYPWRSVDGYIGHSAWVQFFALIGVGFLAASLLPLPRGATRRRPLAPVSSEA